MRSSVPKAYQVIASCLAAVSYVWGGSGDRELTRCSSQTESVLLTIHGPCTHACVCMRFRFGQEPMRAKGPNERPTAVLCVQLSARYVQIRQTAKI